MTERHFRLIEGGLVSKEKAEKEFVSAFATNTRLMGEIAMGIHWKITDHPDAEDLFQFFSFDTEENGMDNYKSVWSSDSDAIAYIRQTMIGPLGGNDILISEREARGLFTKYYSLRNSKHLGFENGIHEYRFLLDEPVELSDDEFIDLFGRLCTEIISDNQLINYCVMRALAKDKDGLHFLSSPEATFADEELFPDLPVVTLLKNTIHEKDGHFICRSLVEYDGNYQLLNLDLTVSDGKVTGFTRNQGLSVSHIEAALMLAKPEFITVYRILAGPEEFEENPLEFDYNTMITEHENGRMYMAFNNNNDHVNDANYMLSNDIFGVYYITSFGEFIVSASSRESIIKLERSLLHSPVGTFLLPTGKYEFQEPVLLNFVHSGFMDFDEFLQAITDPDM